MAPLISRDLKTSELAAGKEPGGIPQRPLPRSLDREEFGKFQLLLEALSNLEFLSSCGQQEVFRTFRERPSIGKKQVLPSQVWALEKYLKKGLFKLFQTRFRLQKNTSRPLPMYKEVSKEWALEAKEI